MADSTYSTLHYNIITVVLVWLPGFRFICRYFYL